MCVVTARVHAAWMTSSPFAIISLLCLDGRCVASGLGVCLRAGHDIVCFDFLQYCADEVFPAHIVY